MENNKIDIWENDPGTGNTFDGGKTVEADPPNIGATTLPTSIVDVDQPPPVAQYKQETAGFRYWNLAAALARASAFWSPLLPDIKWQTGSVLRVVMDRSEDLQSEYNRVVRAIRFFHKTVSGRTVFTCESPDLVYHEMGHAVLDAIKPELWSAPFAEVHAFHEAFGDISAILCGLQVPSLLSKVLEETGGTLYSSCSISKFAKQFGWAKRQLEPSTTETDCYRNAVNSFFYSNPDLLPPTGTVHELTNAPHSLSRVFTGAIYEGLAGMFSLQRETNEATLLPVCQDMATILVNSIRAAVVFRTFFAEVATKMVHLANATFPDKAYGQALRSAFIRHGILSLASAAEFATPFFQAGIRADFLLENISAKSGMLVVPVAQYGLGIANVVVQGAEKMKSSEMKKATASATRFIESLIAKGKLKMAEPEAAGMSMKVLQPVKVSDDSNYTHELKKEGNECVLERLMI